MQIGVGIMHSCSPLDCYCAYLRKSRADRDAELRGDGETLARHRCLLTELSAKLLLPISKFYCEVGSGDTIADRPVMQQLLCDVESGKWTGVFVVEVERLARGNTKDQGIVADSFKYSNTQIITPSKIYDPSNEFDEEYFEFGLFMSRREYKTINRRLQRGRIAAVKEGRYICSTAPYGYTRIPIPHDKGYTLAINPSEADVVRMIYQWYCYGDPSDPLMLHPGFLTIARKLDSLSIKPRHNPVWSRSSVSDILQNPTYTGKVFFGRNKERTISQKGILSKTRQTCDHYTLAQGIHPAIISTQLFELAQKIRKNNRKNTIPGQAALQNPLSGILYCKKCGSLMTRLAPNTHTKYASIKCPNRYCRNISSPLFLVEEQLLEALRHWLASYQLAPAFPPAASLQDELSARKGLLRHTQTEIASLKHQMAKAYDLLEQEVYTVGLFKQRQSTLLHHIHTLEQSEKQMTAEITRLSNMQRETQPFFAAVPHLLDTYSTNTAALNNRILHEIVEKVYYDKQEANRRGCLHHANFDLDIFVKLPPDYPLQLAGPNV